MMHVTTIKGPPKTYKTEMLILIANQENARGHRVRYVTGDEAESVLRFRGLNPYVTVSPVKATDRDWLGKVVSTRGDGDTWVWRIRLAKKKETRTADHG